MSIWCENRNRASSKPSETIYVGEFKEESKSQTKLKRNSHEAKVVRTTKEENEDISTERDQQHRRPTIPQRPPKLDTGMCPLGLCEFNESRFTHTSTGRLIRSPRISKELYISQCGFKRCPVSYLRLHKKLLQINYLKQHTFIISVSVSQKSRPNSPGFL